MPDLLSRVQNPIGGVTTVGYEPSSTWTNLNLPFVLQTVLTVTQDNGQGTAGTTVFNYGGGMWHAGERRFLGFQTAFAERPESWGTARPRVYYDFVASLASAGKPWRIRYFAGSSDQTALLKEEREGYDERNVAPYYSRNNASETDIVLGGSRKTTRTERAFDPYGNVIELRELGDRDRGGDERFKTQGFAYNTSSYIVSLPAYEKLFGAGGTSSTALRQTLYQYDGADSYTVAPTKGDLTAEQRRLDVPAAQWVTWTYGYDGLGQPDAGGRSAGEPDGDGL